MKLAVLKLGHRINQNLSGSAEGEVYSIIRLLSHLNEVSCYTQLKDNDKPIELNNVSTYDLLDFDYKEEFDALIMINGGLWFNNIDEYQVENLKILNNFKGRVYYFLCDPMLTPKQYYGDILKEYKLGKLKKEYSKDEIDIKRNDIIFVTQQYDLNSTEFSLSFDSIPYEKVIHFPFYKFPLYNNNRLDKNINKDVDLIYGGSFRYDNRTEKFIKFYFGMSDDIDVELFGHNDLSYFNREQIRNLRPPRFSEQVKYDQFLNKMGTSLSTVCIGDKSYEGKNLTQRIYESILSNCVTFIDEQFDPIHLVYGSRDPFLDLLYVNYRDELKSKIRLFKNDDYMYNKIIDTQYEAVKINRNEYANDLNIILESNL